MEIMKAWKWWAMKCLCLKSNGKLKGFKIGVAFEREIDCSEPKVVEYEGLGYDAKSKYLLLVAKERTKDVDDKKMIYAYDFDRKVLFKHIANSPRTK